MLGTPFTATPFTATPFSASPFGRVTGGAGVSLPLPIEYIPFREQIGGTYPIYGTVDGTLDPKVSHGVLALAGSGTNHVGADADSSVLPAGAVGFAASNQGYAKYQQATPYIGGPDTRFTLFAHVFRDLNAWTSGFGPIWTLFGPSGAQKGCFLYYDESGDKLGFVLRANGITDPDGNTLVVSVPNVRDSTWHDVGVTVDRMKLVTLYFDGVAVGSADMTVQTGVVNSGTQLCELGAWDDSYGTSGRLAEAVRWQSTDATKGCLSAAQMNLLHNLRLAKVRVGAFLGINPLANLAPNQDFSTGTGWVLNALIAMASTADPTGGTAAKPFRAANTTSGAHQVQVSPSPVAAGASFTFSVSVLAGEAGFVQFTDNSATYRAVVDVVNGVAGTTQVGPVSIVSIVALAGGWKRITITATQTGTNGIGIRPILVDAVNSAYAATQTVTPQFTLYNPVITSP